ncbi:hypothetical protein [Clostridium sp.]|uniref:hypothetical protein n=1 Tax=Clostridium sp. TaxID=1506 RepID=UPI001A3E22DF|nr:hypothetical protein [Clostridium sp.]MBK5239851.1 hypothetical protein [Clostridium sp.]
MEETIQNFLNQIVVLLSGLAMAIITLYVAKAKAKLEIEISKIKDEKAKGLFDSSLKRLSNLVLKGVNSAEQTLIIDIKKQIELGKASKEDLIAIGKNVADTVYNQLSEDAVNILKLEITDLEGYIMDSVESQILTLKNTVSVTPIAGVVNSGRDIIITPVVTEVSQPSDVSSEVSKAIEDINSRVTLGVL